MTVMVEQAYMICDEVARTGDLADQELVMGVAKTGKEDIIDLLDGEKGAWIDR